MDVVALGELLIDFTPHGVSEQGQPLYERNPGGAPANVLAALAKLGRVTAFIGAVGEDAFGEFLGRTLEDAGVNTGNLIFTREAMTTLAFVHLYENGDRTFTFGRKPGADYMLRSEDIDRSLLESARVFHFGSISLTNEPSRTATLEAAAWAKKSGLVVTYDPNLRMSLWRDENHARDSIVEGMRFADVVKVSEEELLFLTGTDDLHEGSRQLMESYGLKLLFVTLGPEGSFCRAVGAGGRASTARHGGFRVDAVDTTGAGDAFFGGALHCLLDGLADSRGELAEEGPGEPRNRDICTGWTEERLRRMLAFANAMGALTATGKGAIPSLPPLERAEQLAFGE